MALNWIRQARLEHGLTARQLAMRLGVSSAAVSAWERGISTPSPSRIRELAEFFGLPVREVVERIMGQRSNPEVSDVPV